MKRNRRISGIAATLAVTAGLVIGAPAAQAATSDLYKESPASQVLSCKHYNHPWCR